MAGQFRQLQHDLADRKNFAAEIAHDPFRDVSGDGLLAGLRGKDVLLVFVESYGRAALEDPAISPGVKDALKAGTGELESAGFSARSAFLTSPTSGRGQLAGPLHPAVRALGGQPAAVQPAPDH